MKPGMQRKPMSAEDRAAHLQRVKDKTLPLRIRFFAESFLKVLLGLGVAALLAYGGFSLWSLMYAKDRADRVEERLQEKVRETQQDLER